ncbi:MAG: LapA family protein [Microbacterium sp.]|nr:LapA family protein [Microbacterium sp.]
MSQRTAPPRGQKNRPSGKAIMAISLLIVTLVFVFSNLAAGPIHFLFWSITMPTWIWFLIVLGTGVTIGSLFPWFRPRRK